MAKKRRMVIDSLDDCMILIKQHAAVCMKKLRQPLEYDYDDIVSEGIATYYNAVKHFNTKQRSAAFKTYFITALRNRFGYLVIRSYKWNKIGSLDYFEYDDGMTRANHPESKELLPHDIVSLLDLCAHLLSTRELEYLELLLSTTQLPTDKQSRKELQAIKTKLKALWEK